MNSTSLLLSRRTAMAAIVVMLLLAASCGSERPELESSATSAAPDARVLANNEVPEPQKPEPLPLRSKPEGTPQPTPEADDPWRVITITADSDTGVVHPHDDTFRYIELFDKPNGEPVYLKDVVLNPTYFRTDLTLMITEGDLNDSWVKVQVPVRPNGSEAWVNTDGFSFDAHRFHATVDLSDFHVQVFEGEALVVESEATIGASETPTPLGRWFVNDKVEGDHGGYGNWILSLSAFSETLDLFNGGLPVIAIHGTNSPQDFGSAASNGCVRVPNDVIDLLAETLPLGTPVDIVV